MRLFKDWQRETHTNIKTEINAFKIGFKNATNKVYIDVRV